VGAAGFFSGFNQPGLGFDYPAPSNADVESEYSYTSVPPRVFYGVVLDDLYL
jgi:hypothetical protein